MLRKGGAPGVSVWVMYVNQRLVRDSGRVYRLSCVEQLIGRFEYRNIVDWEVAELPHSRKER